MSGSCTMTEAAMYAKRLQALVPGRRGPTSEKTSAKPWPCTPGPASGCSEVYCARRSAAARSVLGWAGRPPCLPSWQPLLQHSAISRPAPEPHHGHRVRSDAARVAYSERCIWDSESWDLVCHHLLGNMQVTVFSSHRELERVSDAPGMAGSAPPLREDSSFKGSTAMATASSSADATT